jgi:hypothetical protein
MSAYEVIQNLAIGVVSGIFSGVIVSMVFYLLGNYQNEIEEAKRILMPLYEAVVLEKAVEKYGIENSEECIQIIQKDIDDVTSNLNPNIYSCGLRIIMSDVDEIVTNGQYYKRNGKEVLLDENRLHDLTSAIKPKLDELIQYECNFKKNFSKRIFQNKFMLVMGVVVIAMVAIILIS